MKKVLLIVALVVIAFFAYKWLSSDTPVYPKGSKPLPFGVDAVYLMDSWEKPKQVVDSDVTKFESMKPASQSSYLSKIVIADSYKVLIALSQANSFETILKPFETDTLINVHGEIILDENRVALAYSKDGQSVIALLVEHQPGNFSQLLYLPSGQSFSKPTDQLINELSEKVQLAK